MKLNKFRWSKVYESSEEELQHFLAQRNLQATRTDGESMTEQEYTVPHQPETIYCAEGSFNLLDGDRTISMQPGDGITLTPDTIYTFVGGISGYVLYKH